MTTRPYGATPAEWYHFDEVLELTADLLPVVSNPNAVISEKSSLKDVGQSPSLYNNARHARGFPKWTEFKASWRDISKWEKEPDNGICIQCRSVRGLDIDVVDPRISDEIADIFFRHCGRTPSRIRSGTSRQLLAFRVFSDDKINKRVIRLKGGDIVEALANGQQFVAIGHHKSGTRYEWLRADGKAGLPLSFPVVSLSDYLAALEEIAETFGKGVEEIEASNRRAKSTDDKDAILGDEILGLLDTIGQGSEGQYFIECPNIATHSTDSGISQTAYFPAGTRGYERGHFKCQHASCASMTDADFIDALFPGGIASDDFEEIKALPVVAGQLPSLDQSKFERDGDGDIYPYLTNFLHVLSHPEASGYEFRFDVFLDRIVCRQPGTKWRSLMDHDFTRLEAHLMRNRFLPIQTAKLKQAVELTAFDKPMDSAQEWLMAQAPWDGVPRIATFFSVYFGTVDSEYTRAVGLYTWTALAGRVLVPGCQADMAPVLCGTQGLRKTTTINAMAPEPELAVEIKMTEDTEDTIARKSRGKLIAELNELAGVSRKDIESLRAFLSRRKESWIPKYKEFETTFLRRVIYIGSTNEPEFLNDPHGHRRWLPMLCGVCWPEGVEADRAQLWAEAREMFLEGGVAWQEAERLAPAAHAKHIQREVWQDPIAEWLDAADEMDEEGATPAQRGFVSTEEVLDALGVELKNRTRMHSTRVSEAMRALGWEYGFKWVNGKSKRRWSKRAQ